MTRSKLWRAIMFVLMVLAVSGLAVVAQGGQPPGGGPGTPPEPPGDGFRPGMPGPGGSEIAPPPARTSLAQGSTR